MQQIEVSKGRRRNNQVSSFHKRFDPFRCRVRCRVFAKVVSAPFKVFAIPSNAKFRELERKFLTPLSAGFYITVAKFDMLQSFLETTVSEGPGRAETVRGSRFKELQEFIMTPDKNGKFCDLVRGNFSP